MTNSPTPNTPLTADDVKLLRKGDWYLDGRWGAVCFDRFDDSSRRAFVTDVYGQVRLRVPSGTFLGRPDQSGWIPHDGRENPAPGLRVDVRCDQDQSVESGFPSVKYDWSDQEHRITHWRPHVPAPAGEGGFTPVDVPSPYAKPFRVPAGAALSRDLGELLSTYDFMAPPQPKGEVEAAVYAEMFPPETTDVQSRYVIVHQLRASADIQSDEITRTMGQRATTDRAELMRKAAGTLEVLLSALTASQAREARAVEALRDLASWFEGGPSGYGPWIIPAGKQGADDAVEAARKMLSEFIDNGEDDG